MQLGKQTGPKVYAVPVHPRRVPQPQPAPQSSPQATPRPEVKEPVHAG